MQAKFFEILQVESRKGMTVFFSSHLLNEVQKICKKVAIIKEGKIIGVEEIETLRKKQLKKIMIEFTDSSDTKEFRMTGYENNTVIAENSISFMFSGDINELTKLISEKHLNYLTIEEPTLEEIFMHYYN
jgi:ABC-2 type transport system ATP-binding protein